MDHDCRFAGWTNQVYNVPEDKVTDYRSHTLIIMDDIARDANGQPVDQGEGSADAQHASKCQAIYRLFRDRFTNCQIRSARMPRNHDERYLLNFMEQELSQKTRRDVVTIYFNGKAGGDGKEYTWSVYLANPPYPWAAQMANNHPGFSEAPALGKSTPTSSSAS